MNTEEIKKATVEEILALEEYGNCAICNAPLGKDEVEVGVCGDCEKGLRNEEESEEEE